MQSRIIEKNIDIEGRRFVIRKFTAFTAVKTSKMLASKILPLFQSFLPALSQYLRAQDSGKSMAIGQFIEELDQYISLEGISHALDLLTGDDLDYIMQNALLCCSEQLPAGSAPVMLSNGTFGVDGIEYDPLLMLRLVCEAILWGLGDFFTADRWTSIMKPVFNSFPPNLPT